MASRAGFAPAHGSWDLPRNSHPGGAIPKRGQRGVGVLVAKLFATGWVRARYIYMGFQRSLVGLKLS